VTNGHNSAYITLELQVEMINQRIGSNLFSISSYDYEKVVENDNIFRDKVKAYHDSLIMNPGYLWVKEFPTSSATVFDMEAALLKKEEAMSTPERPFKFKNIFIDYINILKNYRNPNSENMYLKIKQLAEDLRAMAQRNGWCIITATQSNRGQAGSSDMTMSSVSESFGLIATVDMLFGIIRDIAMNANGEYYLKIIANRASAAMDERKRFTFDKTFLRIEEDLNAQIIHDNEILEDLSTGLWNKPKEKPIVFDSKSNNGKPVLDQPNEYPTHADLLATERITKQLFS
jgi:hypothetical protein